MFITRYAYLPRIRLWYNNRFHENDISESLSIRKKTCFCKQEHTHIQQWVSTQWSFIKLFSDRNWLGIFLRVPSTLILKVEHPCALLWYDDCLSQEWDVTILGHIVIKQQYNN